MPRDLVLLAQDYCKRFLPRDEHVIVPIPPQLELALSPASLRWVQAKDTDVIQACTSTSRRWGYGSTLSR